MMRMQTIDMHTSNTCRYVYGRQLFLFTSIETRKGCFSLLERPFCHKKG